MRRFTPITAFFLFLAVPVFLSAQHGGGGHGGGGGHAGGFGGGHAGGFSGGHMGGFSGGHAGGFGGSHAGGFGHAGRPFTPPSSAHGFSRGPFLHNGFAHTHNGIGVRIRSFPNNNCWGFACRGYGYGFYPWGWGSYDPSWWWDGSSNDDDSYSQNVAQAAEMNRENLEEQRMLRQEQADGDQDAYASQYDGPHRKYQGDGSAQSDPQEADQQQSTRKGSPIFGDTVLIFRDKHQEEVENYAIVGDVLWNFAPGHTQKISLDEIDVAATKRANEDRGMTFRLPSGS